jgi:hypothetical protein
MDVFIIAQNVFVESKQLSLVANIQIVSVSDEANIKENQSS